ncbi:MAG: helix-turn-helix domain-containing protein, partial [Candidatus Xenobia bacterium]
MRGQLSRLIRARREELRLTQQQVSVRLQVARTTYAGWERGSNPVPADRIDGLADALQLPVEQTRRRRNNDRQVLYTTRRRRTLRSMPHYPVRGTLEDMLALTPFASNLRKQANLTPALERELLEACPRDCPDEMMAMYQFLAAQARLEFRAPLAEGCRRLITERNSSRYAGDRLTHVFRLPTPDGDILLFPQVTIATDGEAYRVDFLIRYQRIWAHLEIDDPGHDLKPNLDDKRTGRLRMKRFTYDVATIRSPRFLKWFLNDLQLYIAAR